MRKIVFGTAASGVILAHVFGAPAAAHEYEVGAITVEHPWLRTPAEGKSDAPLFMVIRNKGDQPERLLGAASEKVGKSVIHTAPNSIVYPPAIVIPAHGEITLQPGGAYVGLHEVKKMNPVGWGFELELTFEKSGQVTIDAAVEAPDAQHAHDAEAMVRWEKSHAATDEAAKSEGKPHHHDAGADAHHHDHDAGDDHHHHEAAGNHDHEGADAIRHELLAAEPGPEPAAQSDANDARYEAERQSMDHSKQNFGVPGIAPRAQ